MVAAKKVTIGHRSGSADVAGHQGVRPCIRRSPDGSVDRARDQEAALGDVAVRGTRRPGRRRARHVVENDAIRLVTGA